MKNIKEIIKRNKKVLILFISLIILFLSYEIPKYRFGYFVSGPNLNFDHHPIKTDLIELENGDILFIGNNTKDIFNKKTTPSEIYNLKEEQFKSFNLTNEVYHLEKGILLNNNKLLLTYVSDKEFYNNNINHFEHFFNKMALLNLSTNKVEKVFTNKINKTLTHTSFTKTQNNEVLIINFKDKKAELYNPETNTSKIFYINTKKEIFTNQLLSISPNKVLIFGASKDIPENINEDNYHYTDIEELNIDTGEIKRLGKIINRSNPQILKLDNDKILIFGGFINTKMKIYPDIREIEIYDLKTNKTTLVNKIQQQREYQTTLNKSSFSVAKLDKDFILVFGGESGGYYFSLTNKSSEILNINTERTRTLLNFNYGPNLGALINCPNVMNLQNGNILIWGNSSTSQNKHTTLFKRWNGGK